MKNKMSDVRDHLVQMMELLNDEECKPEVVDRAKAMSGLAGQFIAAAKVEIDAVRLYQEVGELPSAITGQPIKLPGA